MHFKQPSQNVIMKLQRDFENVMLIVVDEVFSAPIIYLAFLDKLLRQIRPYAADAPLGGIPIVMAGDPLQLPSAQGLSVLEKKEKALTSAAIVLLRQCFKYIALRS